jgi:hypothetical protein
LFFSFFEVLQANSKVAPKTGEDFLISNFRRVLNIVFFLLVDSPASVPSSQVVYAYTTYEDGTNRVFRNVGT